MRTKKQIDRLLFRGPAIIVHGGAWAIPDDVVAAHRHGVTEAIRTGWRILHSGGNAVDAVVNAVSVMEDDETFDAGRGSFINAAGEVELDASVMDGRRFRAGGVAAVQDIANPVRLARLVMERSEHVLLVGRGATRFGVEHGMTLCKRDALITAREVARWREAAADGRTTRDSFTSMPSDTVGAVAIDRHGNIASATSTGGTPNKYPGRVGDSPLIGCGNYADNAVGGVSCTGWGEGIIKVVLAKCVVEAIARNGGDVEAAAQDGIRLLQEKADGLGGVIALNKRGMVGYAFNTPRMARGYMCAGMRQMVVEV